VRHSFQPTDLSRLHPIGNRRSAALVSAYGSIDWWSPAGIEAPASAFRLLHRAGGHLSISLQEHTAVNPTTGVVECDPVAPILTTTLRNAEGVITIVDVIADAVDFVPSGTLMRLVSVVSGAVNLRFDAVPGSRFAAPRRTYPLSDGLAWADHTAGSATVVRGMSPGEAIRMRAGESVMIAGSSDSIDGRVRREVFERMLQSIRRTWRSDVEHSHRGGPLAQQLWRQLLLLTDSGTGALYRSMTTSLPMRRDGDRQVDGRLVWIDDVARAIRVFERGQRNEHAEPLRHWLSQALRVNTNQARRADPESEIVEHDLLLEGWYGHIPVRDGDRRANRTDRLALAHASTVLDGNRDHRTLIHVARSLNELFDTSTAATTTAVTSTAHTTTAHTTTADRPSTAELLTTHWALRAAARTIRQRDPLSLDAAEWHETGERLSERITKDCVTSRSASGRWLRAPHDERADARLLRWIAPPDPTMNMAELRDDGQQPAGRRNTLTVDHIVSELSDAALLHQSSNSIDDGFSPGQAADVASSAELVSALCRVGQWELAHERMERLMNAISRHDASVCTVPQGIDPRSGEHLGNRPYAPAILALWEARQLLDQGPA
jgi:hypothetical protein